jgi:hypothetical protein
VSGGVAESQVIVNELTAWYAAFLQFIQFRVRIQRVIESGRNLLKIR